MTGADPQRPEPGPDATIDDIQADIEQTRTELGQTVGALSAKLDVKQRVADKKSEVKHRVAEKSQQVRSQAQAKPAVPVAAVALVVLILGIIIWKRRR
jgi:hypothetical protein